LRHPTGTSAREFSSTVFKFPRQTLGRIEQRLSIVADLNTYANKMAGESVGEVFLRFSSLVITLKIFTFNPPLSLHAFRYVQYERHRIFSLEAE
jgi:hypothetical protein